MKLANAVQMVLGVGLIIGLRRVLHWVWPDRTGTVDVVYLSILLLLYGVASLIVVVLKRRLRARGIDPNAVDE